MPALGYGYCSAKLHFKAALLAALKYRCLAVEVSLFLPGR